MNKYLNNINQCKAFILRVVVGLIKAILINSLLCYQKVISPILPKSCCFYPSCSNYAIEAITKKPLFLAIKLIMIRLLKCHPWRSCCYDPLESDQSK